ncbi:winged helix-turn-helix domain-containing protein [Allokutzneria multivorans]|uniref:Winged helix-turn-helix domain-containing protein n=1 Tax=Allokutzneria multivorans TaxID=1142134 RepID=A0ABP7SP08_9PSEU
MLRIRFGPDDLPRIRFLVSPLVETLLSVRVLAQAGGGAEFGRWRRRLAELTRSDSLTLLDLVPQDQPLSTALVTALGERATFDRELQDLATHCEQPLHRHLRTIDPRSVSAPSWMWHSGGRSGTRILLTVLRRYHETCLQPDWAKLRAHLEADLADRSTVLLANGTERLLSGLHPTIRWRAPVLELAATQRSEVDLAGRGLVLAPSAFLPEGPQLMRDLSGQPILAYPTKARFSPDVPWSEDPLRSLVGQTRAAILRGLGQGGSTTQIAQRVGVSLSRVSEHLTVLRHCGLIATARQGRSMWHAPTALAQQLLNTTTTPAVSRRTPAPALAVAAD